MNIMDAMAVIIAIFATGFVTYLCMVAVRGLWRMYRSGPPSRMATRTAPRPDDRSSIEQFRRIHRP